MRKAIRQLFLYSLVGVLFPTFAYMFDVPPHNERVTDNADIFSVEEEQALELQLQQLEESHQAEIAVLTLSSLL
jgi:uncharacterized membrane protein YgcG